MPAAQGSPLRAQPGIGGILYLLGHVRPVALLFGIIWPQGNPGRRRTDMKCGSVRRGYCATHAPRAESAGDIAITMRLTHAPFFRGIRETFRTQLRPGTARYPLSLLPSRFRWGGTKRQHSTCGALSSAPLEKSRQRSVLCADSAPLAPHAR